ncbi:MAG: DNA/RNA non-specific endonuclease, partial [Ilumatobacteraceae bacterium]
VELKYRNFSVVMSKSRRLPMVTAANINGQESRRLPRVDVWSYDGRLDKKDQWGDELYADNPLDRGHMVRRADPVWGSLEQARQAIAKSEAIAALRSDAG